MNKPIISVVSPVYKAEKIVPELVRRIAENVKCITEDFEIVLVCDGSPDDSWRAIKDECAKNDKVKGINLSRNFGQHYAITAGMNHVRGEWVVLMDCDLQDRPEEISKLYNKALEGYDIVYARRMNREDGFFKKMSSTLFYKIFNWLSGIGSDKAVANFGIYKHSVIAEYNKMPERARSFPTLVKFLGFKETSVDVEHSERMEGKSSYNLHKLLKYSFDVIVSNSNKPLRFAVTIGMVMSSVSFILAVYNVIAKWIGIIDLQGYTTTIFSIWFVGGLLLFVMGIIGLYIGKIFDQVKGRPLFVIKDMININD